jgi:methionyl-tRNA formyltransferase
MTATYPGVDFVHAFVLHPSNVHRYGGYESPLGLLKQAGIDHTFFNDARELHDRKSIERYRPHYVFVCGLRQLVPTEMLWEVARANDNLNIYSDRGGFICFHPSNLPDGAGLAPVQWTIFERQRSSVVSAFYIDDIQIDGGPIISQRSFSIDPDEDARTLDRKIGIEVAESFRDLLPAIAARQVKFRAQDTVGLKRRVRPQIDSRARWLDFDDSVDRILLQVRAFTKPYGGIAALVDDRPLLVYQAERVSDDSLASSREGKHIVVRCCDGAVRLTSYEYLD